MTGGKTEFVCDIAPLDICFAEVRSRIVLAARGL